MTRHELLHQVALAIMGIDTQQKTPMPHHLQYAENVLSTIFDALKEPTEDMMKTIGATSVQRSVWQKMLAASPLAPEGGRD